MCRRRNLCAPAVTPQTIAGCGPASRSAALRTTSEPAAIQPSTGRARARAREPSLTALLDATPPTDQLHLFHRSHAHIAELRRPDDDRQRLCARDCHVEPVLLEQELRSPRRVEQR